MRTLSMFGVSLLAVAALADEAPPPVTKVVLYGDAALVTRALEGPCGDGTLGVTFGFLPPSLDPATMRASVVGTGARIEGVSVSERVREKSWNEEVSRIDAETERLTVKRTSVVRAMERAQAHQQRAEQMRGASAAFIVREAFQGKPNTEAWAAALDATRLTQQQADAMILTAEVETRELDRKLQELQQRRDRISSSAPEKAWEAQVAYRCSSGRAKVELSYLSDGASWSPVYEARSDEAAGKVQFGVMAQVRQSTGETWKDVELTLSTASSRRDVRPPKALRLYIAAQEKEETKKVLVKREEEASHVEAGEAVGQAGGDAVIADQGLSVQLKVPGKSDLSGDGRPTRVTVDTLSLPAKFMLLAVPKALPLVLRVAEIQNAARYPLLAGPIDLFSQQGFLGTTNLKRTAEGAKVELAFGPEESVKVRRVVIAEDKTEAGVFSSTRTLSYAYRFEFQSNAAKPLEVRMRDHIAVSELSDVIVTVDPKQTTAGYETVAADGLLTWKVGLAPGEKKNVELAFGIAIPTKYESGGL